MRSGAAVVVGLIAGGLAGFVAGFRFACLCAARAIREGRVKL